MELTTQQQTGAFLWAFVLGAAAEIIYFVIAAFREAFPPGKIQMWIGDFLYIFAVFVGNFIYAVAMTEGKIRFYVLSAEMISFILLYFGIGRTIKCFVGSIIRKCNERICDFFAKIGKKISEKYTDNRQRVELSKKAKKNKKSMSIFLAR